MFHRAVTLSVALAALLSTGCAADAFVAGPEAELGPEALELAQQLAPLTQACFDGAATCTHDGMPGEHCFEGMVACELPGATGPGGKMVCNPAHMAKAGGGCPGCEKGMESGGMGMGGKGGMGGMGSSAKGGQQMASECQAHMAGLIAKAKEGKAQKMAAMQKQAKDMGMGGMGMDDKGSDDKGSGGMGMDDKGSDDKGSGGMGMGDKGSSGMGMGDKGSSDMGMGGQGSSDMGMGGQGSDDKGSGGMGMGGQGSDDKGSDDMGMGDKGMGGKGMAGKHGTCHGMAGAACKTDLDACLDAGDGPMKCLDTLGNCLAASSSAR